MSVRCHQHSAPDLLASHDIAKLTVARKGLKQCFATGGSRNYGGPLVVFTLATVKEIFSLDYAFFEGRNGRAPNRIFPVKIPRRL